MRKVIILLTILMFFAGGCAKKSDQKETPPTSTVKKAVSYWTCGMHPSVHVTDEEYKKGKKNCPICNMPLTPVYEEKNTEAQPAQGAAEKAGIEP